MRLKEVPVGLIIGLIVAVFSWCLTPVEAKSRTKEEIYQEKLVQLKPDDVRKHYQLGEWCLRNKLLEQAKEQFNKVLELKPDHKQAVKKLNEINESEFNAKIKEVFRQYGAYRGVLSKKGADKEQLSWEKARTKETDHFIVNTNLSTTALDDICILMECAYVAWQGFLGFPESDDKLTVMVTKDRSEFEKLYKDFLGFEPPPGADGHNLPKEDPRNKLRKDVVFTCYHPEKTESMLFHEGTHYAMALVVRSAQLPINLPVWFEEGLATYFEPSKIENKKLSTGLISPFRLGPIKDIINSNKYVGFKDFINLGVIDYDLDLCYPQSWSLIHFLVNAQDGKYRCVIQAYIKTFLDQKLAMQSDASTGNYWPVDKDVHIKLFEECMGVPINQLEEEWKEYILKLK